MFKINGIPVLFTSCPSTLPSPYQEISIPIPKFTARNPPKHCFPPTFQFPRFCDPLNPVKSAVYYSTTTNLPLAGIMKASEYVLRERGRDIVRRYSRRKCSRQIKTGLARYLRSYTIYKLFCQFITQIVICKIIHKNS